MAAMLRESGTVIAGVVVRTNEQYLCLGEFIHSIHIRQTGQKREKNLIEMDF